MSTIYLTVVDGPDAGRETRADGELVVGRGEGAELVLGDPSVSRRHVLVRPEGTTAIVEDLGSANGTYVNSELISDRHRAADGDVIAVGNSKLELRVGPTEPIAMPGDQTEVLTPPDNQVTRS